MQKYLAYFPKPVLDDFVRGKCLPVVGAGMSLNATISGKRKMPLWKDLGDQLVKDLDDFMPTSILDGISAYEHEFGRARLVEKLSELLFIREAQPGLVHREFCSIPFDIVCTTNFDFLLERQYELTPKYVYPVVDEEQLSVDAGSAGTVLLKLHGDLRHPARLIVTEADYDGFLTRYPLLATYLANLLITKTAVFIGYSLDDPDFRQVWHVVSQRLGKTRRIAYAIAVNAKAADIARFERRGVKVINLPGSKEKYSEVLAAVFTELREYIRDNVIAASKITEEEPLRELQLPRSSATRLCFFSLPLDLLPFYRERVFPIVEEAGFVPVTADDVIAPGDNVSAKLDALIDRCSVMVAEVSSAWTMAEVRIAISRLNNRYGEVNERRPFELLVVTDDIERLPLSMRELRVLRRPNVLTGDTEGFVADLGGFLRGIAQATGVQRRAEPERLFEVRAYRAAVISAMTLLESTLRERFNEAPWPKSRRPFSMRALIDQAMSEGLFSHELRNKIDSWMRIRNEAVHSTMQVSRSEAGQIVKGVLGLIAQMGM